MAAVCFAATVHAAIVVLFRLVPFAAAAFHAGYDLSFIPSPQRWLVVVVSLVPGVVGHTVMDVGLFAYWWSQIAGTFSQGPIAETGSDGTFYVESTVLAGALALTLAAIRRLRRISRERPGESQ